jgi:hypothetical protein
MSRIKAPKLQVSRLGQGWTLVRSDHTHMALLERESLRIALSRDALAEVMGCYLQGWHEVLMILVTPLLMGYVTEQLQCLPSGRQLHISLLDGGDGKMYPFAALVEEKTNNAKR